MMHVFINGLSENNFMVKIKKNGAVKELKKLISEQLKITNEDINLSFGGKILNDSNLLNDYNIISNSVINYNRNEDNKGGSFNFVDVNDLFAIKKLKTGTSRPWKKYIPGLNLEGKCRNKNCQAFNKIVICKIGYVNYNFNDNENVNNCPMCNQKIIPESCGFSKCMFRYSGKINNNGNIKEIKDENWKVAKNGYFHYVPHKTKIIEWESLEIKVCKLPENLENGCYIYENLEDYVK